VGFHTFDLKGNKIDTTRETNKMVKAVCVNLTFICPCIASISLKYDQQDATFPRPIYFYNLFYMFQAVPPPVIRSTKLYIQRQVLSNQYCCYRGWDGTDDGRRNSL